MIAGTGVRQREIRASAVPGEASRARENKRREEPTTQASAQEKALTTVPSVTTSPTQAVT